MKKKNIIIIGVVTLLILMVPFVAMQFTDEVNWSPFDFIAMGALIFTSGLAFEFVSSRGGSFAYRAGVGVACVTGFLLTWVNLAVGLIGSEDNPANALYLTVIAVGLTGVALSRFEPRGMSNAGLATALTQALVPVIALFVWRNDFAPGVVQVFSLNSVFVALWIVSAMLLRHAGTSDQKLKPRL